MTRRRALSFRAVVLGLLALTGLIAVAAVVAYFELLHYERSAAYHLPADTVAAARVDVEQGILFEPVRKHLLPLAGYFHDAERDPLERVRRIEKATGLRRRDLREIVAARGPRWSDWVLLLGGVFPDENVIARLGRVLQEEGASGWSQKASGHLVHSPTGIAIGRAADGVLIIAASESRVERALPRQNTAVSLQLPVEAAAGLAITSEALDELSQAVARVPGLSGLERLQAVVGKLELGEPVRLTVSITPPANQSAEETQAAVERVLSALGTLASLAQGPDFGGERALLERARVSTTPEGTVRIVATWLRSEMDRAARSLARAVRRWIASGAERGKSL